MTKIDKSLRKHQFIKKSKNEKRLLIGAKMIKQSGVFVLSLILIGQGFIMAEEVKDSFGQAKFLDGEGQFKNDKNEETYDRAFPQAIAGFSKDIEKNPNNAELYDYRGGDYEKQNNLPQAISDFSKAIELKPNYADAYNQRGDAYRKQGKFIQAISDYSKAIEVDPNFPDSYSNLGLVYENQGNLPGAITEFSKLIEIDPHYPDAYVDRGRVYAKHGNFTQALVDLNRSIELNLYNGSNGRAYSIRAAVYYYLKNYDKSWSDVHKAEAEYEGEAIGETVDSNFLNALKKASGRDQ